MSVIVKIGEDEWPWEEFWFALWGYYVEDEEAERNVEDDNNAPSVDEEE